MALRQILNRLQRIGYGKSPIMLDCVHVLLHRLQLCESLFVFVMKMWDFLHSWVLQSDQVWSRLDWKQKNFIIGQKVVRTPFLKNAASNVDLGKKIANNNQLFRQSDEIIWTQNVSTEPPSWKLSKRTCQGCFMAHLKSIDDF